MSSRTHVPGGCGAEDEAHEHSATAPDYHGLLHAVGDLLRCLPGGHDHGIGYLHDSRWIRGFLALGLLYVVTSSFTLAKCIRDRQEETALVSRVDQARLDKLLAEQDLLRVEDH
jgi:yiaA/B two helix domain